jgi:hypothetical protein
LLFDGKSNTPSMPRRLRTARRAFGKSVRVEFVNSSFPELSSSRRGAPGVIRGRHRDQNFSGTKFQTFSVAWSSYSPLSDRLGSFDFVTGHLLVRNETEKVGNAIEAGPPLVVGADDVPRRVRGVGRVEHLVAGAGVRIPPRVRLDVHRAQFPLAERILNAGLEPPPLLLLAYFQPELDELNPPLIFLLIMSD